MSRSSRVARHDPLAAFEPATRDWFRGSFETPTAAQAQGWPAIAAGQHTLICAPTGSGKTLAAFLWCLDRLLAETRARRTRCAALRVLYVSPLKALVHDVDRNLRAPLAGIALAAERLGDRRAGRCGSACAPGTRPRTSGAPSASSRRTSSSPRRSRCTCC